MSKHTVAHPGRVLLHLVLAAMRATGIAAPEAVLAKLVTTAAEAAIAKASHTVSTAVGARHGMIDWEKDNQCSQLANQSNRWDALIKRRHCTVRDVKNTKIHNIQDQFSDSSFNTVNFTHFFDQNLSFFITAAPIAVYLTVSSAVSEGFHLTFTFLIAYPNWLKSSNAALISVYKPESLMSFNFTAEASAVCFSYLTKWELIPTKPEVIGYAAAMCTNNRGRIV